MEIKSAKELIGCLAVRVEPVIIDNGKKYDYRYMDKVVRILYADDFSVVLSEYENDEEKRVFLGVQWVNDWLDRTDFCNVADTMYYGVDAPVTENTMVDESFYYSDSCIDMLASVTSKKRFWKKYRLLRKK